MEGSERDGGRTQGRRKMGNVAPLGEAALQIRKGGRALVREVKSLFPDPEALDSQALREALQEVEERIAGEDVAGALERLEEGLAPILAGPGSRTSRTRFRFSPRRALFLVLLAGILLLAWVLLRV